MTDAFEEILYLLSAIIDYLDSPNRRVLKINWVFDLIDHVITFSEVLYMVVFDH